MNSLTLEQSQKQCVYTLYEDDNETPLAIVVSDDYENIENFLCDDGQSLFAGLPDMHLATTLDVLDLDDTDAEIELPYQSK